MRQKNPSAVRFTAIRRAPLSAHADIVQIADTRANTHDIAAAAYAPIPHAARRVARAAADPTRILTTCEIAKIEHLHTPTGVYLGYRFCLHYAGSPARARG